MWECETETIQAQSRIFMTYSGIIQRYSKSCITLAYSEPYKTSSIKRFAKIINGYNYFLKL